MSLFTTHFVETITKRFAKFNGRATRSEYWYFFLFNMVLTLATIGIGTAIGGTIGTVLSGIGGLISLVALIPGIAVAARRLQDIGKSGWLLLVGLIPLIGGILLIVWLVTDSKPGDNKWGPNPKGVTSASLSADMS